MNDSKHRIAVCLMIVSALVLFPAGAGADSQDPPAQPAATAEQQTTLSPEQLESMVAPIALYPDTLLSQVLVASTYPLEVVEAQQWIDQNTKLTGPKLVDEAKKQNWDPSVQALVAFPDVLKRLNSDIRWTTDLGNAFLAQQADVMAAVQRLRASAKESGKLTDTPQAKVVTEDQNGQSAIEIQPTDPQVIYVPTYNPAYFWGPPVYPWPGLYYPGIGIGWGWGPGISLGFYFPGCCGWGGWGWGFGWFGGGIFAQRSLLPSLWLPRFSRRFRRPLGLGARSRPPRRRSLSPRRCGSIWRSGTRRGASECGGGAIQYGPLRGARR